MGNFMTYEQYHNLSMQAKDVDPAILCLKYLADRYELNESQRFWICFLYGTNYCAPTTFLIYNEFPDFEAVDVKRLKYWWDKNKANLIFQTDRLRIKTSNEFVPSFVSYRNLTRGNQQAYFHHARNWSQCYDKITAIKNFGRFSAFNYLDAINQLTDVKYSPTYLNMAEAESCRNGLCYAIGMPELVDKKLTKETAQFLHNKFLEFMRTYEGNVYQIETTLCAYKKYMRGQRYVGYYIDRMKKEIEKLQACFPDGVAWEVLWQFRQETFNKKYLKEII